MRSRGVFALAGLLTLAMCARTRAQLTTLDKGHRILLQRGLQIEATATRWTGRFNISRFTEANFNTVNWGDSPWTAALGSAPGASPWAYWVQTDSNGNAATSIAPTDQPYQPNLISVQYRDEQDLNSSANRTAAAAWFASARANIPDSILYCNQIPYADTDANLRDFMNTSHPDMLSIDDYRWDAAGDGNYQLFSDMQRTRLFALSGWDGSGSQPIPYATYTQACADSRYGYLLPSESQLRAEHFAAWTLGFTVTNAFDYNIYPNIGPTGIFFSPSDNESNPTPSFYQLKEINRQAKNLGPALVRLISKDVRVVPGQHMAGGSPVTNPNPLNISNWSAGTGGDRYATAVSVTTNSMLNSSLPGDVLVGYFHVLQESMDGPATDETYFMICNALDDPSGSADQTQQTIHMSFDFKNSGITSLLRLSRDTGSIETIPLTPLGGSNYRLDLTLPGGTADLFKYNDGVAFVPEPDAVLLLICSGAIAQRRRRPCPRRL